MRPCAFLVGAAAFASVIACGDASSDDGVDLDDGGDSATDGGLDASRHPTADDAAGEAGDSSGREICVSDLGDALSVGGSMNVFDGLGSGAVPALRRFAYGTAPSTTKLDAAAAVAVDPKHNELFVANRGFLTVYPRTSTGAVAPTRILSGTTTGLGNAIPQGIAVDDVNDELFVTLPSNSVLVFARTANGNIAPLRTIAGPSTGLAHPKGLAVDTTHDELFVTNDDTAGASVTIYSRTANGDVAPLRTLTGLSGAVAAAVDTANDEVLIANTASITAFSRSANGGATPLRTVAGDATSIVRSLGLAFDSMNGEIILETTNAPGSSETIKLVFARNADGNVAPLRSALTAACNGIAIDTVNGEVIVAENPGIHGQPPRVVAYSRMGVTPLRTIADGWSGIFGALAIAADPAKGEIFVANQPQRVFADNFLPPYVSVYSRVAKADAAPLRTFLIGDLETPSEVLGFAVDRVHGEVFVSVRTSLLVYATAADGRDTFSDFVTPIRTLTSLDGFGAVALDSAHDELMIFSGNRIDTFARTAAGVAAPLRSLALSSTIPANPNALAIDTLHDELVVSDEYNAVAVYPRTAAGAAMPSRRLSGPATGLDVPRGIAIDGAHDELFVLNGGSSAGPSISVFARLTTGNVPPLRTLKSADLFAPTGITLCK